jgi:hypothetical protein
MATDYAGFLLSGCPHACPHGHADESAMSEWRRFSLCFLGLLPIESQLQPRKAMP